MTATATKTQDYILYTGTKTSDFSGTSQYSVVTGYSLEECQKTYVGRDNVESSIRYLAYSECVLTIDSIEEIPSEYQYIREYKITYTTLEVVTETKRFAKKSEAVKFVKQNSCISNSQMCKAYEAARQQSCRAEELI